LDGRDCPRVSRRKDEALGETLVFERDSRDTVVSLLTEGYRYFRQ
jgi:hypothetical protein